jgi:hypothetical protein
MALQERDHGAQGATLFALVLRLRGPVGEKGQICWRTEVA